MIELVDFSKQYPHNKDFTVKNVNLKIEKGSVTGLLGLNGSGKTTIMKAVCGFHFPTKGKVVITDDDGNSFNSEENPELCMQYIGYVPEISALPPDMTVKSFLNYAAQTHGLSPETTKEAITWVQKECSLETLMGKKIKTLSKGQQQRVSFAQALIHNPPNLILDEPISGLDPAQILQMRELIQKLAKNKAVLMSTHILQEVYSLCSNLYIVSQGTITASGTEHQIITQSGTNSLEEAFIKLTARKEE